MICVIQVALVDVFDKEADEVGNAGKGKVDFKDDNGNNVNVESTNEPVTDTEAYANDEIHVNETESRNKTEAIDGSGSVALNGTRVNVNSGDSKVKSGEKVRTFDEEEPPLIVMKPSIQKMLGRCHEEQPEKDICIKVVCVCMCMCVCFCVCLCLC